MGNKKKKRNGKRIGERKKEGRGRGEEEIGGGQKKRRGKEGKKKGRKEKVIGKESWDLVGIEPMPGLKDNQRYSSTTATMYRLIFAPRPSLLISSIRSFSFADLAPCCG